LPFEHGRIVGPGRGTEFGEQGFFGFGGSGLAIAEVRIETAQGSYLQ